MRRRQCLVGGPALSSDQKGWVELLSRVKSGDHGEEGSFLLLSKLFALSGSTLQGLAAHSLIQGLDPGLSLTHSFQMLTRREGSQPVFPLWVAGATCLMGKLFASFRLRSPHHDFRKSVMNECMILELEVGVVLEGWEVRGPQWG